MSIGRILRSAMKPTGATVPFVCRRRRLGARYASSRTRELLGRKISGLNPGELVEIQAGLGDPRGELRIGHVDDVEVLHSCGDAARERLLVVTYEQLGDRAARALVIDEDRDAVSFVLVLRKSPRLPVRVEVVEVPRPREAPSLGSMG
jgi:hypothetical protein